MSCYANKLYYTLGLWDELSDGEQSSWIAYLQSFQVEDAPVSSRQSGAYIDPPVIAYHNTARLSTKQRIKKMVKWVLRRQWRSIPYTYQVIAAETKQTIATLAQLNADSLIPYENFPKSPAAVHQYLNRFDWTTPWGAGAHFAVLCVYLRTQAPRLVPDAQAQALIRAASDFITAKLDQASGSYFSGNTPAYGQLVNGAMKVLTGLDWLNIPIHKPERLIDTCLSQVPDDEGCYLVDTVYVLYRCQQQTDYRRKDIHGYLNAMLDMIALHWVEQDGGFSYYINRSQMWYYGIPLTEGGAVADLHGTILLVWALSMIFAMQGTLPPHWKVIRP